MEEEQFQSETAEVLRELADKIDSGEEQVESLKANEHMQEMIHRHRVKSVPTGSYDLKITMRR